MTPEQIQQQIVALEFAQTELVLYLDVHPENEAAREHWEENVKQLETLTQQHKEKTGAPWPLRQDRDGGTLAWVTSSWPWDHQQ